MFSSALLKTTLHRPFMLGRCGYASAAARHQPLLFPPQHEQQQQQQQQLIRKINMVEEKLVALQKFQSNQAMMRIMTKPILNNTTAVTVPKSFGEFCESLVAGNRNARHPKKANKGKRPCSRIRRRNKKKAIGKWRR